MKDPAEYSHFEAIANRLEFSIAEAILYCRNVSRCFDKDVPVHIIRFWIFQMDNRLPTVDEVAAYMSKNDKSLRRVSTYENTKPKQYPAPRLKEIEIKETLIKKVADLLPVVETDKIKEAQEFLQQVAKLYPSLLRREKALLNAIDKLASQNKLSVYRVWKLATKYKKPYVRIISTPMGGKSK